MHRDGWTGALVVAELVRAFGAGKGAGIAIYSPRKNRFEPIAFAPVAGLRLIERTGDCLGRESRLRYLLLAYARARAQRKVAQLCAAQGWNRRTFYNRRDRAAALVAACLNAAYRANPLSRLDDCTIPGAVSKCEQRAHFENQAKNARQA